MLYIKWGKDLPGHFRSPRNSIKKSQQQAWLYHIDKSLRCLIKVIFIFLIQEKLKDGVLWRSEIQKCN
ncbi:unnamed protein product [Candida parapsilosis]